MQDASKLVDAVREATGAGKVERAAVVEADAEDLFAGGEKEVLTLEIE
jgi:hypothetical protein